MKRLDFYLKPNESFECEVCEYQGVNYDLIETQVYSAFNYRLAGREGIRYTCPNCNNLYAEYIWRIS